MVLEMFTEQAVTRQTLVIMQMLGRRVLASQTNLETVDVSSLTNGIYLLQLNLEKGQLTKKLIVE